MPDAMTTCPASRRDGPRVSDLDKNWQLPDVERLHEL
jgi:hypothetical protein